MGQTENRLTKNSLYSPRFEHDNCGIGAVVNIKGIKSHDTVANALTIVETLEHRAGKDAEGKTGDGVGILLQISHKFFKKAAKEITSKNITLEEAYNRYNGEIPTIECIGLSKILKEKLKKIGINTYFKTIIP